MGGTQAAKVLAQIEASSLKKSGEVVDEAKEAALSLRSKPVMTNRFHLITLPLAFGQMLLSILLTPVLGFLWVSKQQPRAYRKQFNLGVIQV
jgi:hypothetical protein